MLLLRPCLSTSPGTWLYQFDKASLRHVANVYAYHFAYVTHTHIYIHIHTRTCMCYSMCASMLNACTYVCYAVCIAGFVRMLVVLNFSVAAAATAMPVLFCLVAHHVRHRRVLWQDLEGQPSPCYCCCDVPVLLRSVLGKQPCVRIDRALF